MRLVRPRVAVPIHWGTLHPIGLSRLRPQTRIDPPHDFARLAAELAPETIVHVVPIGGIAVPAMASLSGALTNAAIRSSTSSSTGFRVWPRRG